MGTIVTNCNTVILLYAISSIDIDMPLNRQAALLVAQTAWNAAINCAP